MKKTTLIILIIVVAGILGWKFFSKTQEPVNVNKNISLRLAWLHGSGFEGYYAAQEKGFYQDVGLDVVINPGGVDFNPIRLVTSGSDNFGLAGAVEVLEARDKGIPIKAIAAIYQSNPIVYFSLQGKNITTPQNWVGKKIGVKFGLDTEILYRALLQKFNISSKQVIEVPVKFDMTPLFRNEVDVWPGFINVEPIIAKSQGFDIQIIKAKDFGIPMYAQVIFAREDFIKENPAIVKKFLSSTIKGWQYALQNEKEAIILAIQYDPQLNQEFEEQSFLETKELVKPNDKVRIGLMEESVWQSMINILFTQYLLKNQLDAKEIFTNEFLP